MKATITLTEKRGGRFGLTARTATKTDEVAQDDRETAEREFRRSVTAYQRAGYTVVAEVRGPGGQLVEGGTYRNGTFTAHTEAAGARFRVVDAGGVVIASGFPTEAAAASWQRSTGKAGTVTAAPAAPAKAPTVKAPAKAPARAPKPESGWMHNLDSGDAPRAKIGKPTKAEIRVLRMLFRSRGKTMPPVDEIGFARSTASKGGHPVGTLLVSDEDGMGYFYHPPVKGTTSGGQGGAWTRFVAKRVPELVARGSTQKDAMKTAAEEWHASGRAKAPAAAPTGQLWAIVTRPLYAPQDITLGFRNPPMALFPTRDAAQTALDRYRGMVPREKQVQKATVIGPYTSKDAAKEGRRGHRW